MTRSLVLALMLISLPVHDSVSAHAAVTREKTGSRRKEVQDSAAEPALLTGRG